MPFVNKLLIFARCNDLVRFAFWSSSTNTDTILQFHPAINYHLSTKSTSPRDRQPGQIILWRNGFKKSIEINSLWIDFGWHDTGGGCRTTPHGLAPKKCDCVELNCIAGAITFTSVRVGRMNGSLFVCSPVSRDLVAIISRLASHIQRPIHPSVRPGQCSAVVLRVL